MTKTQAKAGIKGVVNKLPVVAGMLITANLLAAWVFSAVENVSYGNSFYWSWVTSLSVGYGDISPGTTAGKYTAVLLGAFVLYVITPLVIGIFVQNALVDQNEFDHDEQEQIKSDISEIKVLLREATNAKLTS